jgi:hypothetical protein
MRTRATTGSSLSSRAADFQRAAYSAGWHTTVVLLASDRGVRVITEDGEPFRHLTIDLTKYCHTRGGSGDL